MDSFEASEILGLPRSTLYRWRRRLEGFGPKGLEDDLPLDLRELRQVVR